MYIVYLLLILVDNSDDNREGPCHPDSVHFSVGMALMTC